MPHGTVSTCPSANAEPMSSAMSMRAFPWSPAFAAQSRHFAVGGQAGGRRAHAGPGVWRPETGQGAHRTRPRSCRSRTPERDARKTRRSGRTARLRIAGTQAVRNMMLLRPLEAERPCKGHGGACVRRAGRSGRALANLSIFRQFHDQLAQGQDHSLCLFSAPTYGLLRRSACSRDRGCLIPRENHAMGCDLVHENPPKRPLRPFEPISHMRGRSSGCHDRHFASPQLGTPR